MMISMLNALEKRLQCLYAETRKDFVLAYPTNMCYAQHTKTPVHIYDATSFQEYEFPDLPEVWDGHNNKATLASRQEVVRMETERVELCIKGIQESILNHPNK
jgi:hypothetical protein